MGDNNKIIEIKSKEKNKNVKIRLVRGGNIKVKKQKRKHNNSLSNLDISKQKQDGYNNKTFEENIVEDIPNDNNIPPLSLDIDKLLSEQQDNKGKLDTKIRTIENKKDDIGDISLSSLSDLQNDNDNLNLSLDIDEFLEQQKQMVVAKDIIDLQQQSKITIKSNQNIHNEDNKVENLNLSLDIDEILKQQQQNSDNQEQINYEKKQIIGQQSNQNNDVVNKEDRDNLDLLVDISNNKQQNDVKNYDYDVNKKNIEQINTVKDTNDKNQNSDFKNINLSVDFDSILQENQNYKTINDKEKKIDKDEQQETQNERTKIMKVETKQNDIKDDVLQDEIESIAGFDKIIGNKIDKHFININTIQDKEETITGEAKKLEDINIEDAVNLEELEKRNDEYLTIYFLLNDNTNNKEFLDEAVVDISKKEEEMKALELKREKDMEFDLEELVDENRISVDLSSIMADINGEMDGKK